MQDLLMITIDVPYEEAVLNLMEQLYSQEKADGFIRFKELPGVQASYNTFTGKISLKPTAERSPYVTVIFEKKAFPYITTLLKDSICLSAKRRLLVSLHQLNDDELSFYIYKNIGRPLTHFTLTRVDQALFAIMRSIEPLFIMQFFRLNKQENRQVLQIVANELKEVGIHNIKSQSVTKNIMDAIKIKINNILKHIKSETMPSQMK